MADTQTFWEILKTGKYDVVISKLVMEEVERCREPKQTFMKHRIIEIEPLVVVPNQESENLAEEYVNKKVLSQKSIDDCMHIALSVISRCDYLVSWNFRHLVNVQTIEGVRIVNAINHYQEIKIVSPNMFLK